VKLLKKIIKIHGRTVEIATFFAGILLFFLMLSVGLEVVLRYFFNRPTIWVAEVSGYILLYITFLVAAWVLRREGHVKMDLVISRLSPKTQSLINAITSVVGAIIFLLLTWYGVKATWYLFQVHDLTATLMRVPKFIIVAIIPVGSFLFFTQFLRRAYNYLVCPGISLEKEEEPVEKPRI